MMMLRFGVEVEVADTKHYPSIDIEGTYGWKITCDESINPHGMEFISPIFTWDTKDAIFTVIDIIKTTGGFCNQSCGFHVHMSGDFPPSWDAIKEPIWKWYRSILPGFMPAKRRKNGYCQEKLGTDKHQIVRPVCEHQWTKESPHIELRLFNAHLCKRWIYRCLKVSKQLGELLESKCLQPV
jgi:hypothetical protein